MKNSLLLKTFLLLWPVFAALNVQAQQKPRPVTRILFVFDASNSMNAKYGSGTRIEAAKSLFENFIDSLQHISNLEFGLRMYGHQKPYPPQDCDDYKLEVPFYKGNVDLIKKKVKEVVPKGTTPIAHSLNACAGDFPDKPGINMIILITDGIEECGGDPCEVSKRLQEKGIIFKPFIIGLGLTPEQSKAFDCVGSYYDINNPTMFTNIMDVVVTQTLNKTTAQVNLLNISSQPSETDVNMTFYDQYSGNIEYNFMHTINNANVPDTLPIDPMHTYRIVTHTIPPVEIKDVKLTMGRHNVIPMDTPQGALEVKRDNTTYNSNDKVKFIVRRSGDMNTLNVQDLNRQEKYLLGTYDIEILTLPRINIENLSITQSNLKSIAIPNAGMVKISTGELGNGSIYLEEKSGLRWVANLSSTETIQTYYLQPGNYRVEFRPKSKKESAYTVEKRFTLQQDDSRTVNLF
jgi:Ca-activated chloride channel family protein